MNRMHQAAQGRAQPENLARVAAKLEGPVMAFARKRWLSKKPTFHMVQLTAFVERRHPGAPDSAGRILRKLRASGRLGYVVINRRRSQYRLTKVRAA